MFDLLILIPLIVIFLFVAVRVINEYERGVMFRLGRLLKVRGPGLNIVIPIIDRLVKVDLRTSTAQMKGQEAITQDNVPVKVDAVIWYKVVDPVWAVTEVEYFSESVVRVALTTLRSTIGKHSLDEVLKAQSTIAEAIKAETDKVTEPWGVSVERIEMQNIEIPETMQRALAQEAEALREKRARLIKAEAEFEASIKLAEAAKVVAQNPMALELRRMQMISEVGAENNTTTIIMVPTEIMHAPMGAAAIALAKNAVN